MIELDPFDVKILLTLQQDGSMPTRAVAEAVNLSQNACWRRLQRLQKTGVIKRFSAVVDAKLLGLDLTVFMMIRTRHHSLEWAEEFSAHVARIPQIIEMHRIGGEWDYLLKVVTQSMGTYDKVYQKLTDGVELETVTGLFSMETILSDRPLTVST